MRCIITAGQRFSGVKNSAKCDDSDGMKTLLLLSLLIASQTAVAANGTIAWNLPDPTISYFNFSSSWDGTFPPNMAMAYVNGIFYVRQPNSCAVKNLVAADVLKIGINITGAYYINIAGRPWSMSVTPADKPACSDSDESSHWSVSSVPYTKTIGLAMGQTPNSDGFGTFTVQLKQDLAPSADAVVGTLSILWGADVTAPTGISITNAGSMPGSVMFTANAYDGHSGILGFRIWVNGTPYTEQAYGATNLQLTYGLTSKEYVISNLTADASYTIEISAVDYLGNESSRASTTIKTKTELPQLTVTKPGAGTGLVTSSPAGIDCGASCTSTYIYNQAVTLTAAATSPSTFGGWGGDCTGSGATCKVTMSQARNVSATFNAPPNQTLIVTKAGTGTGKVTSSPAGIDCGAACSSTFGYNMAVTLTAAATSPSTFSGWSGACTGAATTCQVAMSQARNVSATFNPPPNQTLTVTKAGTGTGKVTSSPSGVNCGTTCAAGFAYNKAVTLTAAATSPSTFVGWSGDCSGASKTCQVTMVQARNVTATFTLPVSSCAFTLNPDSESFTTAGGTGRFQVTTSCSSWTAAAGDSWITSVSSTAGSAGGTVGYSVKANTGASERQGTIALVGKDGLKGGSFTIRQTGMASPQVLTVPSRGTASVDTHNGSVATRSGYATVAVTSGVAPYGTAVFSFKQNGVTVTEAGVPASPPTNHAVVFVDYRLGTSALPGRGSAGTVDINTGVAVVNTGAGAAGITYTLRGLNGSLLAVGHGTLAAGAHIARFVDQFKDIAPDFKFPATFSDGVKFASLEISADQPLSILALRMTVNQRGDVLFATVPIADLTQPLAFAPVYFPQFADGGGNTSSIILLNTSTTTETGTLQILDKNGLPFTVTQAGGTTDSSFRYSILQGGAFRFQTDGSPLGTRTGWVKVTPDSSQSAPVGAGIFSFVLGSTLVAESGIPSTNPTTHALVYVDLSQGHNTGLAIANTGAAAADITFQAYRDDGLTEAGVVKGPLRLAAGGHDARFADEFILNLPDEFVGVLDISSPVPFAALTVRTLTNERGDFLMTTFPVADLKRDAPSPIVFPQIADGGGNTTQFILISAGQGASTSLSCFDEAGAQTAF
jgi:hypothetical protein